MLIQILIRSEMVVITTLIHTVGMTTGLKWLKTQLAKDLIEVSSWARSLVVAVMVVILFVTTIIEAAAWAVTYLLLGAEVGLDKALYFSTVTNTTLGFGDIVLESRWQLLSSLEAANGIIMFGWTTALIMMAIRTISERLKTLTDDRA